MPQLSLYLNEATMAVLKSDCEKSGKSLSSYVAELITDKQQREAWPQGYWESVYGALSDDTFQVPQEIDCELDGVLPSL